jgi:hypothetical protein
MQRPYQTGEISQQSTELQRLSCRSQRDRLITATLMPDANNSRLNSSDFHAEAKVIDLLQRLCGQRQRDRLQRPYQTKSQRDRLKYSDLTAQIPKTTDCTDSDFKANKWSPFLLFHTANQLNHNYRIGEQVLFKVFAPKKLEARWHGPYEIIAVHANKTLTIRLNAHAVARVNRRRLKPYRS